LDGSLEEEEEEDEEEDEEESSRGRTMSQSPRDCRTFMRLKEKSDQFWPL
jgi:hypothetical protein